MEKTFQNKHHDNEKSRDGRSHAEITGRADLQEGTEQQKREYRPVQDILTAPSQQHQCIKANFACHEKEPAAHEKHLGVHANPCRLDFACRCVGQEERGHQRHDHENPDQIRQRGQGFDEWADHPSRERLERRNGQQCGRYPCKAHRREHPAQGHQGHDERRIGETPFSLQQEKRGDPGHNRLMEDPRQQRVICCELKQRGPWPRMDRAVLPKQKPAPDLP